MLTNYTEQERRRIGRLADRLRAVIEEIEELDDDVERRLARVRTTQAEREGLGRTTYQRGESGDNNGGGGEGLVFIEPKSSFADVTSYFQRKGTKD